MKKLLCLLLAVIITLAFTACDTTPDSKETLRQSDLPSSENNGNNINENINTGNNSGNNNTGNNPGNSNTGNNSGNNSGNSNVNNNKVSILTSLQTLLNGYKLNPKSSIPSSMLPENSSNWINPNSATINYGSSVSVSNIPKYGTGEQWHMVIENIEQSQIFFNTLSVVDGLVTTSIATFNNYLDKNPNATAHHTFKEGIYTVTISCTNNTIFYVIDYEANFPALGNQAAQIALAMDMSTNTKTVRVQLGNANALAYTIEGNNYTFAIKYLGVRRAYFELKKNSNDSYSGHIYEYLTVSGVEIASVADFYIDDDYVTVVGNKADGLIGFEGSICELYSTDTGRMVAYEVNEKLSALGVEVDYNTLWFNLGDISGINSISHKSTGNDNEKAFFVNGSSKAWKAKKVGGFSTKAASRRFDIEFRTQYFYYYDAASESCKTIEIEVPMLFVQEEYYDDMADDIDDTNDISVSVKTSSTKLSKLMSEYDEKVPALLENKDKYTTDMIIEYIGDRIVF